MGLFSKIMLAPLAPAFGVITLARELQREANEQLYGEQALRRELLALQQAVDNGEMTEAEYDAAEYDILWRLEQARRAAADASG